VDIADLNLSVRAYNAVCRAGIKTIPELYEKYQLEPEWLHREIGKKHMAEVAEAMAAHRDEVFSENHKAAQERLKQLANNPQSGLNTKDETINGNDSGNHHTDADEGAASHAAGDCPCLTCGTRSDLSDCADCSARLSPVCPCAAVFYGYGIGATNCAFRAGAAGSSGGDAVHLRGDTPKIHEITRQEMEGIINTRRFCTKVWRIKESEENTTMIQEGNTLSIENSCFISMRTDLDAMLQSTIDKMISKQSDEATITLKIGISLVDAVIGQPVKKPTITHKVTSAITTKESVDGYVAGDYSLYFDDDEGLYAMRELPPDGGQLPLL
jgi:hypothetical protein